MFDSRVEFDLRLRRRSRREVEVDGRRGSFDGHLGREIVVFFQLSVRFRESGRPVSAGVVLEGLRGALSECGAFDVA